MAEQMFLPAEFIPARGITLNRLSVCRKRRIVVNVIRSLKLEEVAEYNKLSSICFTYPINTENLAPKELSADRLRGYRGCFDEEGKLVK